MNKPKVFIEKPIPLEVEEYISQYCDYKKWSSIDGMPRELLYEELKEVQGLLTSGTKIDMELLGHAPKLKVISNISVGYNNFNLDAMKAKGVIGTNTPYVLDDTVADLILGLILSAGRRIAELDLYVKQGKWKKSDGENLFGIDIHHSTLGIIGMGRIGEAVAS
ncbi:MAG: 2-ketogluconate reductase [Clostridiales bacterium]|nr:2-ketogluconate reductase [Clostridiales bacterium]